jgi:predicted nucleic acid-binding protein
LITAVDTNILIDVLNSQSLRRDAAEQELIDALEGGALVISEAVYAELAAYFTAQEDLDEFLADSGVRMEPSNQDALWFSGRAWRQYVRRRPNSWLCPECGTSVSTRCRQCGASASPRQHVLADFIIGAHALVQTDRLLTRDRGYYRTYFPDLDLI